MSEEVTSKKYEGLIAQARKVSEMHEESGWRMAEFVTAAVAELKSLGLTIIDTEDRDRLTAVVRVARDVGLSRDYVIKLRSVWLKYGDTAKRMEGLTFADHFQAARSPRRIGEIKKNRARIQANTTAGIGRMGGIATRAPRPPIDPVRPYDQFTRAKSGLRKILAAASGDYPDREKALAYAQQIHQLAVEALIKFGGQQQAPAPRARKKVAA